MSSNIADIIHNIRHPEAPKIKIIPSSAQSKKTVDISKLSLEDLGLDNYSMNLDGNRRVLLPQVILNAFYKHQDIDPNKLTFYDDLCRVVRIPSWDYQQGNPPLYKLEEEILNNRIYNE